MAIFVTIYNYRAHNYFITKVMKFRNYFPSSNYYYYYQLLVLIIHYHIINQLSIIINYWNYQLLVYSKLKSLYRYFCLIIIKSKSVMKILFQYSTTCWMFWQIMPFDAGLLIFAHNFLADQTLWLRTIRYRAREIIHFPIFLKCTDCIVSGCFAFFIAVVLTFWLTTKGRCIVDRIAADACGRSIGVISAITRQIGRMWPTVRPTCGRRNAADCERRNAFLAFITNAADGGRRRPTHYDVHSRPQCVGRNARPTLRQTMNRPFLKLLIEKVSYPWSIRIIIKNNCIRPNRIIVFN